jgi:hypothetical protein
MLSYVHTIDIKEKLLLSLLSLLFFFSLKTHHLCKRNKIFVPKFYLIIYFSLFLLFSFIPCVNGSQFSTTVGSTMSLYEWDRKGFVITIFFIFIYRNIFFFLSWPIGLMFVKCYFFNWKKLLHTQKIIFLFSEFPFTTFLTRDREKTELNFSSEQHVHITEKRKKGKILSLENNPCWFVT